MTTSTRDILQAFDEIQTLDRELAALESQIAHCQSERERLEREGGERQVALERQATELAELARQGRRLERELAEQNTRADKLKVQLMRIANEKEYQAMTREIQQLRDEIDAGETGQLELMEREERDAAQLEQARAAWETDEPEMAREATRLAEQLGEKQQERERRAAERQARYDELDDAAMRQLLLNLNRQHPRTFIVKVSHGCCGGCQMSLTQQTQLRAKLLENIIQCEGCGRVLAGVEKDPTPPNPPASAE